jgi:hypothetical protein
VKIKTPKNMKHNDFDFTPAIKKLTINSNNISNPIIPDSDKI